jgi:hypothetical protein
MLHIYLRKSLIQKKNKEIDNLKQEKLEPIIEKPSLKMSNNIQLFIQETKKNNKEEDNNKNNNTNNSNNNTNNSNNNTNNNINNSNNNINNNNNKINNSYNNNNNINNSNNNKNFFQLLQKKIYLKENLGK